MVGIVIANIPILRETAKKAKRISAENKKELEMKESLARKTHLKELEEKMNDPNYNPNPRFMDRIISFIYKLMFWRKIKEDDYNE